jgi:hypothetical protein
MRLYTLALTCASALCACQPTNEAAPAPHTPGRGPLVSSLQVEAMGDSARLVLQVTNAAAGPITLTFPSGQTYDFEVRDAGRSVWTWSADRSFMQAVRMVTLAPGETRTHAEVWHASPALHGRTLTAVARLTSSDQAMEQTAEFRLP